MNKDFEKTCRNCFWFVPKCVGSSKITYGKCTCYWWRDFISEYTIACFDWTNLTIKKINNDPK